MAKEQGTVFVIDGKIVEALSNAQFKVELVNDTTIIALASGKMRKNFIRLVPGDKVRVEISVYDLRKGRICFRHPNDYHLQ